MPCIITEGVTDRLYIQAMISVLYSSEQPRFYIVPSKGASNIDRLVSIFIGWGIKYKVLLDYDGEGFKEYRELVSDLGIDKSLIVFVNQEEYKDNINKESYGAIESLISERDFSKLDTWNMWKDDYKNHKTIIANEFYNKVISSELITDVLTKENFNKLFDVLFDM